MVATPPDITGVFKTATDFFELAAEDANANGFNVEIISRSPATHVAFADQVAIIEDFIEREVDVIAIFAPNFARVEIIEEIVDAVKAGARLKGIIAEKPFARNMAEGRRMMGLVSGLSVPTAYFENQIHMKAVQTQRAQLAPVIQAMGPPTLTRYILNVRGRKPFVFVCANEHL